MPQGWQEFTDEIEVNFIRGKRGVNPKYKPEMWNLHKRILKGLPCTDNSMQRWHQDVQKVLSNSRPSIVKTLKFIKKELDMLPEKYMHAMRETETKRRKTEEIKHDNIRELTKKFAEVETYEETPEDLMKFLSEIGKNFI